MRFIEFMPLDAQGAVERGQVVTYDEIQASASTPAGRSNRSSAARRRPSGSATATAAGEIGIIASVTRAFCCTCDRVRLTADGQFRTCLFATTDHDLRGPLRSRRQPTTSWPRWWPGRSPARGPGTLSRQATFIRPNRSMSQIGG